MDSSDGAPSMVNADNGCRHDNDWIPRVGMDRQFWTTYSRKIDFNVRKRFSNKRKYGVVTSVGYVCSKEGFRVKDKRDEYVNNHRAETRTNCLVHVSIRLVRDKGKYQMTACQLDHNHELHFLECTHMLWAYRVITEDQAPEIELSEKAGLTQRQQHDLFVVKAGGRENVDFTRLNVKNYLRNKRQRDVVFGKAGALINYFETRALSDANFFHTLQIDSGELITNIFWAYYRMIIDFELFGDVVTFDTSFSTNKEYRPLGVFLGFNHYREIVIFDSALLYDETADSFRWLFETFLKAHKSKRPATIFTDQDAAMAKALSKVMPETKHGLCTWHLMQNTMKNVGHLMKGGNNFFRDLKRLMYECVEVDKFEED